jgi:O-acetylserine/cysteine efflux transporter
MKLGDILLAALPPALWAMTYTIAKPATNHFPPLFLTSLAYALAAGVLFRPGARWQTPYWALAICATLSGSIQSALIFSGIARVSASLAILVVQSQVPFAVLAAWAIGRESMNLQRFIGIVVSLGGVFLVVGTSGAIGQIGGLLLIVLGTLSWGVSQGTARATSRDAGSQLMAAISFVAAPQLLALSMLLETGQIEAIKSARWLDWAGLAVLAFGGYAAAYTIWYGLLRRYRVDQIAPFALLMPIMGVLASALMLGERPSTLALGGGVIILIGLALVVRAPEARAQSTNAITD